MIVKEPYRTTKGFAYKNKEVKFIKEYPTYILTETAAGYKECFNKQDLGLIKEIEKPTQNARHQNKL